MSVIRTFLRLQWVSFLSTQPSSVTLHPIRDHHPGGGRELFCPRWAFAGELRFCAAKWEFFELPSNFSGESPEQSAGDLPNPAKSLVCSGCSLASALVYGSLSLTTFFGQGQGHRFLYFCRAEALTGELRFCEAKWEFFKLPSNFFGESPERSASNLPSPAKSLVCSGCSLASAVATPPLHYQLFSGKGGVCLLGTAPRGGSWRGCAVPVRPGEGFG